MTVRRMAYVSPGGSDWMTSCHPEATALADILNDLITRIQMVQKLGPLYGADPGQPIRKLEGFDDLWETRIRHASGWYRQFFRFASIAGDSSAVFIDGTKKTRRQLPRHVLQAAERRLDLYVEALGASPRVRDRDRLRAV